MHNMVIQGLQHSQEQIPAGPACANYHVAYNHEAVLKVRKNT